MNPILLERSEENIPALDFPLKLRIALFTVNGMRKVFSMIGWKLYATPANLHE